MSKLSELCKFLGSAYYIANRDGVPSICRELNDSFEFEISHYSGKTIIYVWMIRPHRELMGIYNMLSKDKAVLADTLGYLSFRYQNLSTQILVEREDYLQ